MNQILVFLNANSGAIQALTSVLSFIAAIVLAIITWRYVVLTKVLAKAADTELRLRRNDLDGLKRMLIQLLQTFKKRIAALPYEEKQRERIRDAEPWRNEDIETMRNLVVRTGACSSDTASILADRLWWIKEQVDRIKTSDARIGFDWGLFSWSHWQDQIVQSKTAIEAMSRYMINSSVKENKNT